MTEIKLSASCKERHARVSVLETQLTWSIVFPLNEYFCHRLVNTSVLVNAGAFTALPNVALRGKSEGRWIKFMNFSFRKVL